MRISRTLTLTATVAAAALTLSSVPAHAVTLSPSTVADAYSVMLNTTQAKLVGIGKTNVSNFGVASSTKGSPDAPWLCDLSADRLAVVRGGRMLLSGVDLNLCAGDAVVLAGANGVGKSSLLRVLAGLIPVFAGDLMVNAGVDRQEEAR